MYDFKDHEDLARHWGIELGFDWSRNVDRQGFECC